MRINLAMTLCLHFSFMAYHSGFMWYFVFLLFISIIVNYHGHFCCINLKAEEYKYLLWFLKMNKIEHCIRFFCKM